MGLRLEEIDLLTLGEILDLIIESSNDSYHYEQKATQEDIDKMFF